MDDETPQSDRERVAPPPDRAAAKAAVMEKWLAAEKAGEVPPLKTTVDEEAERAAKEDPDAQQAEPPDEEPKATEDPPAEEQPEAEEPPADAEPEDPKTLRGLAAIEAREKKFREAQAEARAEILDLQADVRRREREILEKERSRAERDAAALRDPAGYFRALGYKGSFRDLAKLLYIAEVGDDAPPELRAEAQTFGLAQEQRRMREEFEAMQAGLERERAELARERQRQEYRSKLNADVAKLAPAKHAYVAALAKRDPQRAIDLMFSEAQQWARENPHADEPPSTEELAERIAKQYDPNYGVKTSKNLEPTSKGRQQPTPPQNLTGRTQLRPPPKSREELREQVKRRLEAGDVE
jgi:hypothetical protein